MNIKIILPWVLLSVAFYDIINIVLFLSSGMVLPFANFSVIALLVVGIFVEFPCILICPGILVIFFLGSKQIKQDKVLFPALCCASFVGDLIFEIYTVVSSDFFEIIYVLSGVADVITASMLVVYLVCVIKDRRQSKQSSTSPNA